MRPLLSSPVASKGKDSSNSKSVWTNHPFVQIYHNFEIRSATTWLFQCGGHHFLPEFNGGHDGGNQNHLRTFFCPTAIPCSPSIQLFFTIPSPKSMENGRIPHPKRFECSDGPSSSIRSRMLDTMNYAANTFNSRGKQREG